MANIGATTAFYKVETSLTRANQEVSKSMERLASGRANANAGDRSSYVAMADTFRMDFAGTKAGIKSAGVVLGYLETGMRVIDAASALVSRIQELAVLGGNATNTTEDNDAIDAEATALGSELERLLTDADYKGQSVFTTSSQAQEVVIGGRGMAMNFGITDLTTNTAITGLVSGGALQADPSDGGTSLTSLVEAAQIALNTARVEAGSAYAAIESAMNYITDLTAQYELGYNIVNDVNFSMETAHLAKNQILQQAATAMLAQANQGQQGLLALVQR